MTTLILKKSIRYCPILQVVVLACGTLFSFLVAYFKGDVSLYLPFISETGAYSPEKCLFSLSLFVGSFLGTIIVFSHFILNSSNPVNENKVFMYLNIAACFIGILSWFGLAGVAAFPMTTVFWAHLVFAAVYFLGSAIYFILTTITTYLMHGKSKVWFLRFTLTISIMIFLFLLMIFFPMSLMRWHKHNDFIPALKKPEDEGFTLVFISSLLEWFIEIIILTYIVSLVAESRNHNLHISVNSEQSKDSEESQN